MTEPGDSTAPETEGRGRLRASHEDREQVVEVLKDAFTQGRLAQDELDTRVGLALASRTYADLADLTADLPARPTAAEPAEPAAQPAGTPARTLAKAARRAGVCILAAFALVGLVAVTQTEILASLALFSALILIMAASACLGYGVAEAWQERRSRAQRTPRPPSRRDASSPSDIRPVPGAAGVT